MRNFKAVLKRELKSYFESPVAYVFIVIFLLATRAAFLLSFFETASPCSNRFYLNLWELFLVGSSMRPGLKSAEAQ